ncbi:ABC transporter B family member 20-like protein, partial [Drosera capensis]
APSHHPPRVPFPPHTPSQPSISPHSSRVTSTLVLARRPTPTIPNQNAAPSPFSPFPHPIKRRRLTSTKQNNTHSNTTESKLPPFLDRVTTRSPHRHQHRSPSPPSLVARTSISCYSKMMISRGLFGWSPPHIQPLTPVSEVSEPPESPSPYTEANIDAAAMPGGVEVEEEEMDDVEEIEPPPAAVPFSRLFACADRIDWVLMSVGSVAAAAHGTALVLYLHYFAKILGLLSEHWRGGDEAKLMNRFNELVLIIVYIAVGVFAAGWIEVSCWILTGERQTAVIRSKYVQVLLNQDMSFFDTYGNNGDIVSQVLSDVLLIQSALSEKVGNYIHNMATFFSGLVFGFINCWQIALITSATGPFIVAAGGISNIFLHRLAENIQDAYAEAASIAEQAVSYARTLYAFTNETLAKYSYATSLQATLRYGILISLVQGLGLGFTYGLAICSCALQLWVGIFLVTHGKAHGGEIIAALFTVILSGLGLNQAATNFYSFEQGRIAAYRLFEMISRSTSTVNQEGNTLASVQGNIEFRNVYFSYLSRPEIPILSGFYLSVPA